MALFCDFMLKPRAALEPGELIRIKGAATNALGLVLRSTSTTQLACITLEPMGKFPAFFEVEPIDKMFCSFGGDWVIEIVNHSDNVTGLGYSGGFGTIMLGTETALLKFRTKSSFGDPGYFDLHAHCPVGDPAPDAILARKWRVWARQADPVTYGRSPLLEVEVTQDDA